MNQQKILKALFFILLPMFALVIYLDLNDMHELANLIHCLMAIFFLFYYFNAWKLLIHENNKIFKIFHSLLKKLKKHKKDDIV